MTETAPVMANKELPSPPPVKDSRRDTRSTINILQEIENTFGKVKTKQDVIVALESFQYLHRIPLPTPNVPLEQTLKDFYRERVLLNDVAFIPDRHDTDRAHAFALTLKTLLQRMTRDSSVYNPALYPTSEDIANTLMQRSCRSSCGSDAFFAVSKLLCVEGTFVAQKANDNTHSSLTAVDEEGNSTNNSNSASGPDDPPIHIDVFLAQTSSGHGHSHSHSNHSHGHTKRGQRALCSRVQVSNSFSIFDVSAVEQQSPLDSSLPLSWLEVDSVVIDEMNYLTGRNERRLHLLVSCPADRSTFASHDYHRYNRTAAVREEENEEGEGCGEEDGCDYDEDGEDEYGGAAAVDMDNSNSNGHRRKLLRDLTAWVSNSSNHANHRADHMTAGTNGTGAVDISRRHRFSSTSRHINHNNHNNHNRDRGQHRGSSGRPQHNNHNNHSNQEAVEEDHSVSSSSSSRRSRFSSSSFSFSLSFSSTSSNSSNHNPAVNNANPAAVSSASKAGTERSSGSMASSPPVAIIPSSSTSGQGLREMFSSIRWSSLSVRRLPSLPTWTSSSNIAITVPADTIGDVNAAAVSSSSSTSSSLLANHASSNHSQSQSSSPLPIANHNNNEEEESSNSRNNDDSNSLIVNAHVQANTSSSFGQASMAVRELLAAIDNTREEEKS